MRLAETFLMPPSYSIEPLALAVGMRRNVVEGVAGGPKSIPKSPLVASPPRSRLYRMKKAPMAAVCDMPKASQGFRAAHKPLPRAALTMWTQYQWRTMHPSALDQR